MKKKEVECTGTSGTEDYDRTGFHGTNGVIVLVLVGQRS